LPKGVEFYAFDSFEEFRKVLAGDFLDIPNLSIAE
jgi:hypothetical protein